jgi:hypothetical protein
VNGDNTDEFSDAWSQDGGVNEPQDANEPQDINEPQDVTPTPSSESLGTDDTTSEEQVVQQPGLTARDRQLVKACAAVAKNQTLGVVEEALGDLFKDIDSNQSDLKLIKARLDKELTAVSKKVTDFKAETIERVTKLEKVDSCPFITHQL